MEEPMIEMSQEEKKMKNPEKNTPNMKNSEKKSSNQMSSSTNSLADWLTLVLLTSVNMLNYMDRTLLAGEI